MMDQFSSLVAILLAISLATERLITFLKTIWPESLGEEKLDENGAVSAKKDRVRRLLVQLLSFLVAWITASFLTGTQDLDLFGWIKFGTKPSELKVHVIVVALLSMGGSAFWNNILGYTKAVKDIKVNEKSQREVGTTSADYAWKSKRTGMDVSGKLDELRQKASPKLGTVGPQK